MTPSARTYGAWGDTWLAEQVVDWLETGGWTATDVASPLQSVALVEAAIESSERDEGVDPRVPLAEARESVEP
ncbi:hypothetical protein I7X12_01820 [Halosimplex litoreum]|uniref:Uncharacterized protein n=1 Tax=Halosimplex litoreum TaxID=1198301 RepID=A0A7T3G004_9EURY|nr:hypothetical protein [Halosimplex litoreum]QPV63398.1 hypothetical protein I7X12_01820 [Halosimplex litoreum]